DPALIRRFGRKREVGQPRWDANASWTRRAFPASLASCAAALGAGTSLSDNVVTYEELILSRELPKSIVIAGAGALGMEFGYVLKNYGGGVTIVEFLPRALPNEDAEVSKEIEKQFKKLGVKVLTGTK